MISPFPFDGIDQQEQALGGSEPETPTSLANRIITKFKGLDISSVNGIARMMKEVEPADVLDVHIIRPTDRLEFRRPTTGPALDICISGMTLRDFFAAKAMQAMTHRGEANVQMVAVQAYALADQMMKQREA